MRNSVCCVAVEFWSITLSCSFLDSSKYNHLKGLTIWGLLPSYVLSFHSPFFIGPFSECSTQYIFLVVKIFTVALVI